MVQGLTWLRQSNLHARRRPSQAPRLGRAQRGKGVRGSPLTATLQLAHAPQKTKPSAAEKEGLVVSTGSDTAQQARTQKDAEPSTAARLSAAEKGGSGVSLDYGNPTRTHAEGQAERRGQAERSEKGRSRPPPTTTQHSTPASQ
jgi:hypothetical protein